MTRVPHRPPQKSSPGREAGASLGPQPRQPPVSSLPLSHAPGPASQRQTGFPLLPWGSRGHGRPGAWAPSGLSRRQFKAEAQTRAQLLATAAPAAAGWGVGFRRTGRTVLGRLGRRRRGFCIFESWWGRGAIVLCVAKFEITGIACFPFNPDVQTHGPGPPPCSPRLTVRFVMVSAPPLPAGFLGGYFFWLLHKIDSVPVTSPQAKKQQPFLLSSSCLCQRHPHSSWGTQDPVARTLVASDLSVTPFTRGNDPEAILSLHRGPGK